MPGLRIAGPITLEGVETGDDRFIDTGALNFAVPSPIFYCHELSGGHDNQIQVGVFDSMVRLDDGRIWATGTLMDTDDGRKVADEMAASEALGLPFGISVDLDAVSMELRVRESVLAEMIGESVVDGVQEAATDENGRVTVAEFNAGDFMTVITGALVRGATLVAMPAFKDAYVKLEAEVSPAEAEMASRMAALDVEAVEFEKNTGISLVSSGFPVRPPAEWFKNPNFTSEYPLTVTDEGRIYGHAAPWGTFHIGFAGQRIEAPRTTSNYAYFKTGLIRTAEGTDIAIGQITMGTGHAESELGASSTLAHYDNTGTAVADVACGEDDYGVWVAGALRPGVTDEQVRELRAAPLSGDWREIRGNLELVALLAVNTPGFPIPRREALVASGAVKSLVASASFGVPEPEVELTREEKLAVREMVAERKAPTPKDVFGREELPSLRLPVVDEQIRLDRIAAAKRKFRAEQAKIRALRAVKGK